MNSNLFHMKNNSCPQIDESFNPLVSVIIPTYNSQLTIERCIQSVKNQTYSHCEIIVVDNCSSDDTSFKSQKLGASVFSYQSMRSPARNYGAKKAKGKYLFHIDSDMELTCLLIEKCVKKCESKGLDALIVPEISVGNGYLTRCRALEKQLLIGENGYESARFIRKEVFNVIGGYDESLESGEDFDIHYRIEERGYIISRIDDLIKHHEGELTFKRIISKSKYYGKTVDCYVNKNKERLKNQMSLPQLYIKKLPTLTKNFQLVPGLFLIKFIEFIFVGWRARKELLK